MVSQLICDDYIYMHHLAKKTIYWYRLENLWRAILEYQNRTLYSNYFKVENFLKGSLDSIPLPYVLHLQWKFKLWMGKFAWGVKAKHCWALSNPFDIKKFVDITQQCFTLLPQVNSPINNLNFHWRWRWLDQIQAIFLNFFYFMHSFVAPSK